MYAVDFKKQTVYYNDELPGDYLSSLKLVFEPKGFEFKKENIYTGTDYGNIQYYSTTGGYVSTGASHYTLSTTGDVTLSDGTTAYLNINE